MKFFISVIINSKITYKLLFLIPLFIYSDETSELPIMDFEPSKQLCVSSTGSSVPKQCSPGNYIIFRWYTEEGFHGWVARCELDTFKHLGIATSEVWKSGLCILKKPEDYLSILSKRGANDQAIEQLKNEQAYINASNKEKKKMVKERVKKLLRERNLD